MDTENISYILKENAIKHDPVDFEKLTDQYTNHLGINPDELIASELNYSTNYTVKELSLIMDYYKLNRRKMRKTDLIEKIIAHELDPENIMQVQVRIRLWENIIELKQHPFFKKYISFNP
jgi:hypothetical protein